MNMSTCVKVLLLLLAHQAAASPRHGSLLSVGAPLDYQLSADYSVQYMTQRLDHYNNQDGRTFPQRYLLNDQSWDKKGPMIVYTGNEGDIEWFYQNTGFVVNDLSKHFNALLVFIEHRYYGKSLPFGKDSFKDSAHLQYLSSGQALSDFAFVIAKLKEMMNTSVPVIAVGGSYGGMLSSWLRMTFPASVVGSYAASAPVWWFGDLTPCNSAYQTITKVFRESPLPNSQDCSELVHSSWDAITSMAKEDGPEKLTGYMRLCSPLKSMGDVEDMMGWLEGTWFNLAMVNYPYPANFLEPLPAWPVEAVCTAMQRGLVDRKSMVGAVVGGLQVYYNHTGQVICFNTSQEATPSLGIQGWDYQSCTEMVMPMCSDGVTDMFREHKWNMTLNTENCMKQFGVNPQPNKIISLYGGKDISKDSNIIFSNGLLDPWSGGGVLHNVSDSLRAVVLSRGAHHLDLRTSRDDDPQELKLARALEMDIMAGWIKDYYETHTL